MAALQQGEPPILTRLYPSGDPAAALCIDPHCLREGEAALVADRLRAAVGRLARPVARLR